MKKGAGENTPNKEINLRRATPADVEAYLAVEKKVAEVGSKTYSPMLTREEVLEEINKGPVYLIKLGDKVIGNISYQVKENGTIYLSGFLIDPEYQRQGFGRQALEKILEEVKTAPRIELVTHPDNLKAVRLYQSLGFKIGERKENYFGDGEPRIVLSREDTSTRINL